MDMGDWCSERLIGWGSQRSAGCFGPRGTGSYITTRVVSRPCSFGARLLHAIVPVYSCPITVAQNESICVQSRPSSNPFSGACLETAPLRLSSHQPRTEEC